MNATSAIPRACCLHSCCAVGFAAADCCRPVRRRTCVSVAAITLARRWYGAAVLALGVSSLVAIAAALARAARWHP